MSFNRPTDPRLGFCCSLTSGMCCWEERLESQRQFFQSIFLNQRLGGGGDVGWVSGWIHKRQSVILSVKLGWIAVNQSDHHRHNHHRHRDPAFIPRWVSFKFKLPSPSSVRPESPPLAHIMPRPSGKRPFLSMGGGWRQMESKLPRQQGRLL